MELDGNGLVVLEREECFRLLAGATLGRIGLCTRALPAVLPVNFLFQDDRILVRTRAGSKLEAAADGAVVAFEVDDFEPFGHAGWSVMVTGVAQLLTDARELASLRTAPIPRWAGGDDDRVIAISTELVSGRRLVPAEHPLGWTPTGG